MSSIDLQDMLQSAIDETESAHETFCHNRRKLQQEQKKQADLKKRIQERETKDSNMKKEMKEHQNGLSILEQERNGLQQEETKLRELTKRNDELLRRCQHSSKVKARHIKEKEAGLRNNMELLKNDEGQLAKSKSEAESISARIAQFDIQRWNREKTLRQSVRSALQRQSEESPEPAALKTESEDSLQSDVPATTTEERPKKVRRTDAKNSTASEGGQKISVSSPGIGRPDLEARFIESSDPEESSFKDPTNPFTPLPQVAEEEHDGEAMFSGEMADSESTLKPRAKPASQFRAQQQHATLQASSDECSQQESALSGELRAASTPTQQQSEPSHGTPYCSIQQNTAPASRFGAQQQNATLQASSETTSQQELGAASTPTQQQSEPSRVTPPCPMQQNTAPDWGKNDIPGRYEAMKGDLAQKLDNLLAMQVHCGPSTSLLPFNNLTQRWVRATMRPILACLHNHYNSNKKSFVDAWEGSFRADFARFCCTGDPGEPCSARPKPADSSANKKSTINTRDQCYDTRGAQAKLWANSCAAATRRQSRLKPAPKSVKKDIPGRLEAMKGNLNLSQKLEKVLDLEKDYELNASALSSQAQTWAAGTMHPILNCFRNHHNSSKDSFVAAWDGHFKANFGRLCCKGDAGEPCCSPKLQ